MDLNMSEPIDGLQRLKDFSLRMTHDLEMIEAKVPAINDLVEQLSRLDLVGPNLITGQVVFQRPANAIYGQDTGEVIQSALAVPGGLGVIIWDCDTYLEATNDPTCLEREGLKRFVAFDDLPAGFKATLHGELTFLTTDLCKLLLG
jgi:hypothetical protein